MNSYRVHRTYYWFVLPALIYMVLFVLYPIIYNVSLSFHHVTALNLRAPNHDFLGLNNYRNLVGRPEFLTILLQTGMFTFGSILFQFTIGFAVALYLNKNFPAKDFIRSAIILGWVLSPIVVGTVWRWMLNSDFGLVNFILRFFGIIEQNISWLPGPGTAMIGVIMANIWLGIPFNMMLLTGGLANLPESVYESSTIDGATKLQQFFYITIPLLKQTIGATLVLGFIYTLKVFDLIWVMTSGGPVNATTTLPVWSYRLSFVLFRFSEGAAAANILFALTLVVAYVYITWFGRDE